MAENDSLYQWILGGGAAAMVGGFLYLLNATGKTSDDLALHKTLVAEKYLTKEEFNNGVTVLRDDIKRVEKRTDDGNKANLDSNEKIRTEMSMGQSTIVTMLSNNNKLSAEMTTGNAAIIAAIGAAKGV